MRLAQESFIRLGMSNILSYSDNVTGSDWVARDPYTADDIDKIRDPNGGMTEYPRTAIPSPFAQLDLVYTAFERLAAHHLEGLRMDMRLVSDALDVAQIFFDYSSHTGAIRIVRWNPESGLSAMMRSGSEGHTLLARTLGLFMRSDADAYNFDTSDDWYILLYNNRVIGSTSSATFTMGAPGVEEIPEIMVEEGRSLFSQPRHLYEREVEFVVWLVHWFNAFPQMRRKLKSVYDYILVSLEEARLRRPELYDAVRERVGNPEALDAGAASGLASRLEALYAPFDVAGAAPRVLGNPLFLRRTENLLEAVRDSDFMILPSGNKEKGAELPLVLRRGFVAPPGQRYLYINRPWREDTAVEPTVLPLEERVLPGTSVAYPWVTSEDFLEDTLIELATPVDKHHFYDGVKSIRAKRPGNGFLLPLKPLFFRYFDARKLAGEVAPGKPMLELRPQGDEVLALLRIPVKKGFVELQRVYSRRVRHGEGDGAILADARLSAAIFPFVRTGDSDIYNVRLFEMTPGYAVSLEFHSDSDGVAEASGPYVRSRSKAMRTSYYELNRSFDHIRARLETSDGRASFSGVILPLWPEYTASAARFTFAVDFGTTNSHVEYSVDGSPAEPLEFTASQEASLVATLDMPGELAQSEALLDIEFIPRSISGLYGFPLRTALAENLTNDTAPLILRSVNVPFLYERKSFNGYKVSTKLKWADSTQLSEQFLRELMLLIRARVLLSRGNPKNVRLLYFYPVSMKRSLQLKYRTLWEDLYRRYLSATGEPDVTALPESAAPAFYYAGASREGSEYVGIDIGGGTTDVVIFKADDDRLHSDLHAIASFRFAGDTLFGDGFSGSDAAHNPLVCQYVEYFSRAALAENTTAYLDVILSDILKSGRSEDINAFLFSVESSEALRGLPELDRRRFNYNALLSDDEGRKIVFVYFLTAIIYYVARLMKARGLSMPKQICFSGTGSKILSIIGRPETVTDLAGAVIEKVYGEKYPRGAAFEVRTERDIPKQITCKGGIELLRRMDAGKVSEREYSPRSILECKCTWTPGSEEEELTYTSVRDPRRREGIEEGVREFNAFFLDFLSRQWRDELGVPQDAYDWFAAHCCDSLPNYLAAGIDAFLPLGEGADEKVEDIPFFYPIAGTINGTLTGYKPS